MNGKLIKIIGLGATIVGMAATLVSEWVADKKLDDKINTKLLEALAEKSTEIES